MNKIESNQQLQNKTNGKTPTQKTLDRLRVGFARIKKNLHKWGYNARTVD